MSGFPRVNEQVQRCVLCLLVWVAAVTHATAQHDWTGPSGLEGNWTNTAYWNNNPPPTDYALIRNGGKAVIDTAGVICNRTSIGSASGTDALRIKTNGSLTGSTAIVLGIGNSGNTGTLEVNGGSLTLTGSADLDVAVEAGTTGIVTVTDGTLQVGQLIMSASWHPATSSAHGGVSRFNHVGGDVALSSSDTHTIGGGAVGVRDASYIQTGGKLTAGQILYIGKDAGSTGLYSISNAVMESSRAFYIGYTGTGRVEIHEGASVTVSNANRNLSVFNIGYSAGGDGTVELNGGTLQVQCLDIGTGGGTGVLRLKGGTLKFTDYRFSLAAGAGGNGLVEQSSGLLDLTTAGTLYLNEKAAVSSRYNISGGTIDSIGLISVNTNANVGAFRLTGSAPQVTFNYIANNASTPFLLEFVLDKSLDHLSPIRMRHASAAYRTGDLRVGLDGGIVLTKTNTFAVIHAGGITTSKDYTSRPDPNMWTEALVLNVNPANEDESRITLANGYKMDDLNIRSGRAAIFEPHAMGHVTLANLDTSLMEEGLGVYMKVDAATYGKTPADLVNALVAAGYTNSTTAAAAPFDLVAVIPKAYVEDGTSYFAWDFTDVTTGATNATVNALRFTVWPPPPGGTIVTIR